MPQLSDTMDAGKILSWRKKEGESVSRGDILAEVETDKANLEIECFTPGTLLKIMVPAGSSAKVGEIIAMIGAPGEAVSPSNSTAPANGASPREPAPAQSNTPSPPRQASHDPASKSSSAVNGSQPSVSSHHGVSSERVKASPLARKMAAESNIDLSTIQGSGPEGRIVKQDILKAAEGAASSHEPPTRPSPASRSDSPRENTAARSTRESSSTEGGKSYPLSKMRETIARRMQESVTQAPHFYVTTSIAMDQVTSLREVLKERAEFKGISINHFVMKACGYALKREPRVNRAIKEGLVFEPEGINIGIITAVEDGLLIPVVKEVDKLSLQDLVFEARAAIERARAGRPSTSDLRGGTFSISNMGMFDVENFTAIINPGQGAVLAVSAIKELPIVQRGQIVIGLQMKVTLSVDHRVIDGVMGATFLGHLKAALEMPALLMGPE